MASPFDPFASFVPVEVDASTLRWPWDPEPVAAAPPIAPDPTAVTAPAQAPDPLLAAPPVPLDKPAALDLSNPPVPLPPPIETLPSLLEQPAAPEAAPPLQPGLGVPAGALESGLAGVQELTNNPFDEKTGDVREDLSDAELDKLLADPDYFAKFGVQLTDLKTKRALAAQARIHEENAKQRQANVKMHEDAIKAAQVKSAAIDADAQRIAETKLVPKDVGLAGVLAAVIGGLIQGRTGAARNAGLDAVLDYINRDLEVQKANLASKREGIAMRRGALANEMALHGDLFRAQEAARQAKLDEAEQFLAAEQQKYAPRGTTAVKIATLRAQVGAAKAEAKQKRDQLLFDNSLKESKQALDELQQREAARHNRASEYLQGRQIDSAAEDRRLARDQRADDKATERAAKEAELDREFAIGGPDGNDLRNEDGTVWRVANSTLRKELGDKVTAAKSLVKLYDRALAIRDRVGGESRLLNSNESQELRQIEAEVKLLRKHGTQGMSSDADMENLAEAGGARDLDSFRSRAPGIEAARARLQDQLNDALRTARYKGPAIRFNKAAPTQNTPEEEAIQRVMSKPTETSRDEAFRRELNERQAAIDPGRPASPETIAAAAEAANTLWDPGAGIPQQRAIAKFADDAAAGDAKARAALEQIAKDGQTSKLRALARAALTAADLGSISRGGEQERTTTSTRASGAPAGEQSRALDVPGALQLGGR